MKMVLLGGDFHGGENHEEQKYTSKNLKNIDISAINYNIILGDGGFLWPNDKQSKYWADWFEEKPYITLVLPGNHENYNVIYQDERKVDCSIVGISSDNGGCLYKVNNKIYYFKRNYQYSIENNNLLVLGGAASTDKNRRIPYKDWWPEEELSTIEIKELFENNKGYYDVILSHTCPNNILTQMFSKSFNGDQTRKIYDALMNQCKTKNWYFGHYHIDKSLLIKNINFHCLYNNLNIL